jgi:PRTRC genetic system protein A
MSSVDKAILGTFPLVAVGPTEGYPPAVESGIRYLAAAEGLWREINLPWIRILHPLGPSTLPLPYGHLKYEVDVKCGPVPVELIREFNAVARACAPQENAAAIVWNAVEDYWRLAQRPVISASADHIEFREATLLPGEHIVIDVHSHGHHPAFFSRDDDRDDAGTMRFSLVVGSFNKEQPTSAMRLCMAGLVLPARVRDGELQIVTKEDA